MLKEKFETVGLERTLRMGDGFVPTENLIRHEQGFALRTHYSGHRPGDAELRETTTLAGTATDICNFKQKHWGSPTPPSPLRRMMKNLMD